MVHFVLFSSYIYPVRASLDNRSCRFFLLSVDKSCIYTHMFTILFFFNCHFLSQILFAVSISDHLYKVCLNFIYFVCFQVLNFYDIHKHVHLKTVLVMDILETVVVLSKEHSEKILGRYEERKPSSSSNSKRSSHTGASSSSSSSSSSTTRCLVLSAGEKGYLYVHVIAFQVRCL